MLCRGAGQADRVGLAIPWGSDPLPIASACGRMEATNRRPPSADLELSPQVRALEGEERRLLRLVEADEALIRLASDKAGEVAAAIAAQAAQAATAITAQASAGKSSPRH